MLGFRTAILLCALAVPALAELEGPTFRSPEHGVALSVPRGWRASAQPTFPGVLLWLQKDNAEARMTLTSEQVSDDKYCQWSVACRSAPTLAEGAACALAERLRDLGYEVAPTTVSKTGNVSVVTLEYQSRTHFLRQAVSADDNRVHSLILATRSPSARLGLVRTFEQVGRTIRSVPLADEVRTLALTRQCQ